MALHTITFKVFKHVGMAVAAAAVTVALLGCEKMAVEDGGDGQEANVTLHFSPYHQESFTRTAEPLGEQLSRLSVAVFRSDGTRVGSTKNYKADDRNYGTVSLSLDAGSYTLVAIAHNGLGNATISSATEVKFASNKMTDTFAYCGTLTVGSEAVEQDIQLVRRVAMVRLTMTDTALPDGVQQLKFYYTGGSSTYDPQTGFGSKASRQTEYRDCYDGDGEAVRTYDIYTLPHEQSDVLTKIDVTPIADDGSEMKDDMVTLTNVPVEVNKITTWSGSLLGGGGETTGGYVITLDTGWDGTLRYSF